MIEKWNAEGIKTAMTAMRSREALSWAAVDLTVCSAYLTPPAKKHLAVGSAAMLEGMTDVAHIPKTSRMFDKIDPTRLDCTTASSHYTVSEGNGFVGQGTHLDQGQNGDDQLDGITQRRVE